MADRTDRGARTDGSARRGDAARSAGAPPAAVRRSARAMLVVPLGVAGLAGLIGVGAGTWYAARRGLSMELAAARDAHVAAQRELDRMRAAQEDVAQFRRDFMSKLLDPRVLQVLVNSVNAEKPDGLDTMDWVVASILWQLKAQDGFAEFCYGEKVRSVHLRFIGNQAKFGWDTRRNPVLELLAEAGQVVNERTLGFINTRLNRQGVFALPDGRCIVRTFEGKLELIDPSAAARAAAAATQPGGASPPATQPAGAP